MLREERRGARREERRVGLPPCAEAAAEAAGPVSSGAWKSSRALLLQCREELEYPSTFDEPAAGGEGMEEVSWGCAAGVWRRSGGVREIPRWRAALDLQTIQYCLSRRWAYIWSGRFFA